MKKEKEKQAYVIFRIEERPCLKNQAEPVCFVRVGGERQTAFQFPAHEKHRITPFMQRTGSPAYTLVGCQIAGDGEDNAFQDMVII